jgi:hypothetical protein
MGAMSLNMMLIVTLVDFYHYIFIHLIEFKFEVRSSGLLASF